jgi:ABC-type sulfate/molybdate transport systems ATPase subunit
MLAVDVRKALREFVLRVKVEIAPGVTIVEGPSGAGKTTLLRLIAGLVRPDVGRVVLDERTLADVAAGTFVPPDRRNIALVFQEYALFPHLDVAANVAYGLRARGIPRDERAARVRTALDRFEIGALGAARVTELSGGQRQRVALARALVVQPAALLLDEPLAALDAATRHRVREELAAMLDGVDVPTLFVSHDPADRERFGGRVLRLERGELVAR